MRALAFLLTAVILASPFPCAYAEEPAAIVGGSPDVSVGGVSAARQGDAISGGAPVVKGSSDVFINGRPAGTAGARTACGGAVAGGTPTVFVNGKPLARTGDATTGCVPK
jgi:uncharacterized Zn-binding protein involved in type VI secretion